MRFTTILVLPLLFAFGIAAGCGSKVITNDGGGSGGGANDDFTACNGPGQCVLVGTSCCDSCGPQDLSGKVAVNAAEADAFFQSVCPEPVPCPACAAQPNPNLFAYCDNGTCRAADTRTHAVSECTSDADCTLRGGTGCCEPCMPSEEQLTAVNATSHFSTLVCAPDQPCDACLTEYPTDASALCKAGHCEVVIVQFPGN